MKDRQPVEDGCKYIFVKYVTKNGRRIYPKKGKALRIRIK